MTTPALAEDRGALTIADRTVQRIATQAVTEVDGADPAKVTAQVGADTVTLDVRLSIGYPLPVAKTTEAAREHLRRRTAELTGLAVSRVDITVTALPTSAAEPRRVL